MSQTPMTPNYTPAGGAPSQPAGFAITSLVLGIISLFFCIPHLAIPCAILAIIFGAIAANKAKAGGGGAGMAKAGFIMGCISIAIDIICVILFFMGFAFFGKSIQNQMKQMQLQQQQQQQSAPAAPAPPSAQ